MKTPKRNKGNGYEADCFPYDGPNQTAFEHARWKRKNRIAQLKRTIARLEAENARLWDGFSRMSKRCVELYDTFIFDKHP